jgi:hypothetical protein
MKKTVSSFSLLVVVMVIFGQFAQADVSVEGSNAVIEPVTASSVRILGVGVKDRKTNESLALACIGAPPPGAFDSDCHRLRFVYVKNVNEVFFVGVEFRLKEIPNTDIQSRDVKAAISDYTEVRMPRGQKFALWGVNSALGMAAAGGVIVAASGGAAAVAFPIVVGGYAIYHMFGGVEIGKLMVANLYANSPVILTQQNGWNWSSHPREVGHNRFQRFLTAVSQSSAVN